MHAKPLQSCPTLSLPMDCSQPDSSVHGIFQARILKWVAISSRESSRPRNWTLISYVSCIGRRILYHRIIWEANAFFFGGGACCIFQICFWFSVRLSYYVLGISLIGNIGLALFAISNPGLYSMLLLSRFSCVWLCATP